MFDEVGSGGVGDVRRCETPVDDEEYERFEVESASDDDDESDGVDFDDEESG
jgi:hypothetical protein